MDAWTTVRRAMTATTCCLVGKYEKLEMMEMAASRSSLDAYSVPALPVMVPTRLI